MLENYLQKDYHNLNRQILCKMHNNLYRDFFHYYKVENNKNHLKKLYVILKNDSFRYLTNENIEKIENKSNIKFNRPTGKLELETNDDVKKILNFLNDDFLEGIVSEKPFLTSNKKDI